MSPPGLLEGVRVLELGGWRPVAHATQLLVDLGADVIRVESPAGDPMRTWPDLWRRLAAGKRIHTWDLSDADDRAQVLTLAADADVVVEGLRPGTAARLGVGPDAVRAANPAVVYCSLSGFGQTGPLAGVAGHDLNFQAWAGALMGNGAAPVEPAIPVADLAAGTTAAFAICAALVRAGRTGRGDHLDIGMSDVMVTWSGVHDRIAFDGSDDEAPGTDGVAPGRVVPGYGLLATADGGWVALGVASEDHFWDALCRALGLHDLVGLGLGERLRRGEGLHRDVADAIATRERDDVVAALLAADVPAAPVLSPSDLPTIEHHRQRGVVADLDGRPTTGFPGRVADHPPLPPRAPEPTSAPPGWRDR